MNDTESNRAIRITSEGEFSAWFGSPEDIILNKLIYFREGGSEKHLRDIAGMMKLLQEKLDRANELAGLLCRACSDSSRRMVRVRMQFIGGLWRTIAREV